MDWNRVEDRLPNKECIATCNRKECYGYGEMIIGYISENKNCETGYIAENENEILRNITHWMEKPKLPEED
jgi:hypothetical protein